MQSNISGQIWERDIEHSVPANISCLNARPGSDWTPAEVDRVARWWLAKEQVSLLLQYATLYLGRGATPHDVEDAVAGFYELFEPARKAYRPNHLDLCTYFVKVCFKRQCNRIRDAILRRRSRELSLDFTADSGTELELELDEQNEIDAPYRYAHERAMVEELSEWLNSPGLSRRQKEVFILRHVHDMSYEEIAKTLECPLGSIKGWLHRANAMAAEHLRKQGWLE